MSAARNLPVPELATWTITIDATFKPSIKGIVVGYGDTVMFQNNSGVDISIQVTGNAPGVSVGVNVGVSNGNSSGFQVPNVDSATNYFVYVNGVKQTGPYAIQVQNGCMYVSVTNNYSSPDPVAIPPAGAGTTPGGKLEMYSTDTTYNLSWPNLGDPFTPVTTQINPGIQNNQILTVKAGSANADYSYTIQAKGPGLGNGGGKVKIGSGN